MVMKRFVLAGWKECKCPGKGADPAALLLIYLDFEQFAEATSLVLGYIQAWSSLVCALVHFP